jgi:hypothetical protein
MDPGAEGGAGQHQHPGGDTDLAFERKDGLAALHR